MRLRVRAYVTFSTLMGFSWAPCDKRQTLHDGSAYWALPVQTFFSVSLTLFELEGHGGVKHLKLKAKFLSDQADC